MELLPQLSRPLDQPLRKDPPFHPGRKRISHIALIGNHLPRRCGIATYTTHVAQAVANRYPDIRVDVWAIEEPGKCHSYPDTLVGTIRQDDLSTYLAAARAITASTV